MRPKDYILKTVETWVAPPENDVRVLGMPQIYEAVQGRNCQPRTIERASTWDKMRKRCYFKANYTCEACGKDLGQGECQAHEIFSTNYRTGEAKFERLICLCKKCHLYVIHNGRALTRYKHGDPMYSKKLLLDGVEHAFRLVSEYNKHRGDSEEELLLAPGFLAYVRQDELRKPIMELLEKYNVRFYKIIKHPAKWEKWHVLYNGKKYMSPYKDHDDWEEKMKLYDKAEKRFEMVERYRGGVFDEIDKIIEEEKNGETEIGRARL